MCSEVHVCVFKWYFHIQGYFLQMWLIVLLELFELLEQGLKKLARYIEEYEHERVPTLCTWIFVCLKSHQYF